VQFIPFNKFKDDPNKLAQEVLKELPKQMVDYFNKKKIKPNPPVKAQKNWKLTSQANQVQQDSFFVQMKQQMVRKCVQQGMD
jgi:hypothetical protein